MTPSITDCISYLSGKVAHAMDSGVNHREKIAAGAPAKVYKCSIRRDFAEAIVQHLQVAQQTEAAWEEEIETNRNIFDQGFKRGCAAGKASSELLFALYGAVCGVALYKLLSALL